MPDLSNRSLTVCLMFCFAVLGAGTGRFLHGLVWRGEKEVRLPASAAVAMAAGAAAFAGVFWKFGLSLQGGMWTVLAALLLCLSCADCARRVLPDPLLLGAAANRLAFLALTGSLCRLPRLLLSALCVSVPLMLLILGAERVLRRKAFGGGDLKLLFVLGLYFGWEQMLLLLAAACVFGIAGALWRRLRDSAGREREFPFGPDIAAAAFLVLLCGEPAGWMHFFPPAGI